MPLHQKCRRFRMAMLTLTSTGYFLISLVRAERAYPLGCSREAPEYYDYDNSVFPPPFARIRSTSDFSLLRRLGAGKFSDVFEAVENNGSEQVNQNDLVVLKCLKPVSDRKIRRELLVLSHASKLPNLARLKGLVIPEPLLDKQEPSRRRTKLHPMPSLVLEHAGVDSQWFCHGRAHDSKSPQNGSDTKDPFLSEYEVQYFLCHLLVALDSLHSKGIMHRDLKPRNVMIRRSFAQSKPEDSDAMPLMLIDLGLADFYLPNTQYNVRVASRHYKAPELLVSYQYYDYALDMWGIGCILAGLLLRREPFFRGKDNVDQLGKVISVLGTNDLVAYVTRYNIQLEPEVQKVIAKYTMREAGRGNRKPWLSFLPDKCPVPNLVGLDLLDKLLVYDHDNRLTAKQAIQHAFFDNVRDVVMEQIHLQRNRQTEDTTTSPIQPGGTPELP